MEPQAECMLVLMGATPEGQKELIGFQTGMRVSAQSWKELLVDLKARGLSIAPQVATGDGALGFWKARATHARTRRFVDGVFCSVDAGLRDGLVCLEERRHDYRRPAS